MYDMIFQGKAYQKVLYSFSVLFGFLYMYSIQEHSFLSTINESLHVNCVGIMLAIYIGKNCWFSSSFWIILLVGRLIFIIVFDHYGDLMFVEVFLFQCCNFDKIRFLEHTAYFQNISHMIWQMIEIF